MMSRRRWYAVLLVGMTIGCSRAFAGTYTVTVKAVDAEQRPVPKADVALNWRASAGAMLASGQGPAVTGADGKAQLRILGDSTPRPMIVLSPDRKLGALLRVSSADDGKELLATLLPAVHVTGKLQCTELSTKPEWLDTAVQAEGFEPWMYIAQGSNRTETIDFVLPPGKYTLNSYGPEVEPMTTAVTLTSDRPALDLGTIELKAKVLARMTGKTPPPLVIADARGVPRDVKLEDFKGKWVYIEFWGFW